MDIAYLKIAQGLNVRFNSRKAHTDDGTSNEQKQEATGASPLETVSRSFVWRKFVSNAIPIRQRLREFVKRGGHRLLMTDVQAAEAKQQRMLKLPTDFQFKNTDTAGDKFLKLVTYQVNQKRESRKKPLTDEERLALQKVV